MARETGWQAKYDDRFGTTWTRPTTDESVRIKRPADETERETHEVVARVNGDIYHRSCASEHEAVQLAQVYRLLADWSVEFEEGDDVYVVSEGFTDTVQPGFVVENWGQYRSIDVAFPDDPYNDDTELRVIATDPDEMIHADAGPVEVLTFLGQEHLLEPEDFQS